MSAPHTEAGGNFPSVRRLSSSLGGAIHHAWDALHHHHHVDHPPCELADALIAKVKEELGPEGFGPTEAAFCDPPCLQRYLRARGKDVGRAAAMLKHTLEWRREFGVDKLKLSDYEDFMGEGWIYMVGNDDAGHSVMMLRKRSKRLDDERIESFIGYLVLLLESSTRMMLNGQETWTWVFDMAGYESRNSPRFDVTLRVLQLVANHYPERLNKVFIMDAPTLFWVLFKALAPFLDPVTKSKVEFVYSKDVAAAKAQAEAAASDSKLVAGGGPAAAAGGAAAAADTATARFMPFHRFWAAPYDRAAHTALLQSVGWPQ